MAAPPLTDSNEYTSIWELVLEMEPNIPLSDADKVTVIDRALRYLPIFTNINEYNETANSSTNLKQRIIVADLVIARATMSARNSEYQRVHVYNVELDRGTLASISLEPYSKQFQRDVYAFGYELVTNPPWTIQLTDGWSMDNQPDADYRETPDN